VLPEIPMKPARPSLPDKVRGPQDLFTGHAGKPTVGYYTQLCCLVIINMSSGKQAVWPTHDDGT